MKIWKKVDGKYINFVGNVFVSNRGRVKVYSKITYGVIMMKVIWYVKLYMSYKVHNF